MDLLADRRRRNVFLVVWPPVGAAMGVLPFWWAGGQLNDWWAVALWGEMLALPVLGSAYVCRAAPIATAEPWRILATISLASVITAGEWLLLGWGWLWLVSLAAPSPYAVFDAMTMPAALGAVFVFMLASAVNYTIIATDEHRAAAAQALHAEVGAREAELRALRAQVDPHFLFNCLHSISSLIGSDPPGARLMCIELADFFRESLRVGTLARVPLSTEVELTRRYLDIERLRFGSRLEVTMTTDDSAGDFLVPPLMLQPLAENAVRHGVATLVDGGHIGITVAHHGTRLEIRVENPYDPEERRGGTGIGLTNVRARLDATYGGAATLRAEARDSRFVVLVSLPAERPS